METVFWIFGLVQLTSVFSISIGNKTLSNQNGELVHATHGFGHDGKLAAAKKIEEAFNEISSKSFFITGISGGSGKCEEHTKILYERANQYDVWALKILDSSAKIPSGVLNGNLNQLGDFDQCLSSFGKYKNEIIRGKYCLATVDIKIQGNDSNEILLDDLIHARRIFTNELSDPGHRIPKLETFNWGVCIPDSCSNKQLESALNQQLQSLTFRDKITFHVAVDEELCYVNNSKPFTTANYLSALFFLAIITIVIWGTLLDGKENSTESRWKNYITCFSLKRNLTSLLSTDSSNDDIPVIHGARFLNAIALLLSHKQMAMMFNPFMNRTDMTEFFGKTWSMIGRSAIIYTDTFIMMSGFLVSYSMIKKFDFKRKINIKEKVLSRYIRFTPNLLAIILFSTYILEHLGSGPQWGLVVDRYSNLCKKYMWRNFLYIHNYFGFENMCLTHTHQLGIDMQLFLMSPLFVYILWKNPRRALISLSALALASTVLRYVVTYQNSISTLIHYGIPVERLWKTANLSYILPTHRLTAYLAGVMFGYFIRRGGNQLTFTKVQVFVGWTISISAGLLAMFGPYHMAFKNYVYNPTDAALYNAFAPILWAIFLGWATLACINGYGSFLSDFLSWKYFQVFTKISYALYLTQFPVYFYNVGSNRSVLYYKGFHSLFDISEQCVIFGSSILLTLFFDLPFQNLRRMSLKKPITKKEKQEDNLEMDQLNNGKCDKTEVIDFIAKRNRFLG